MARSWRILVLAAALCCGPSRPCAGGVLDSIRGELNESSGGSSSGGGGGDGSGRSGGGSSWSTDDDEEDPFAELAVWLTLGVVTSPFTLPVILIGDSYEHQAVFPESPYAADGDGYLLLSDDSAEGRNWAARLSIETGGNFDDLSLLGGRLQLETGSRLGLDAAWSTFNENLGGRRDRLTLGDANFLFRFAQSESIQFASGIGFNWMADEDNFDAGFNFTYGFDWFPVRPLVVSSTIDLGALGGATLFRSRTTVGAMIDRFEAYSGFDYLNVEGIDVPMGIAGLRIWY